MANTTMSISDVVAANTEKLTKKINSGINKVLKLMREDIDSSKKVMRAHNNIAPGFIHGSYEMRHLPKNKCVSLTSVEVIERENDQIPIMFRITIDKSDNDKGTSGMLPFIYSKIHRGEKLSFIEEHVKKGDLGFQAQAGIIDENVFYMLGFDIDDHGYNNDSQQYVATVYFPPDDIVMRSNGRITKTIKANTLEWFKKKFAKM